MSREIIDMNHKKTAHENNKGIKKALPDEGRAMTIKAENTLSQDVQFFDKIFIFFA